MKPKTFNEFGLTVPPRVSLFALSPAPLWSAVFSGPGVGDCSPLGVPGDVTDVHSQWGGRELGSVVLYHKITQCFVYMFKVLYFEGKMPCQLPLLLGIYNVSIPCFPE